MGTQRTPILAGGRRELSLARWEIRHGRFQRSMTVMAAFAGIVSGFEAYMQHLRGAFNHWLMWTPVLLTPVIVVAAGFALVSRRAAQRLLPLVSLVTLIDGIVGFVYHLKGIRNLPGGFRLGQYNIVMGPPVFAPLLVCIVGVLGGLAGLLRPEKLSGAALLLARATSPVTGSGSNSPSLIRSIRTDVASGRFQRGMALVASFFAILAGGEAYFEHLRGSFNQRVMWTPVWVTPPMVLAGIGAALSRRLAHRLLPIVSVVTFLDGLLGFALHLRGAKQMPGGLQSLRFNLMMGPPLFAPLLFCSVGLLGLIAALLRRPGAGGAK